MVSAGARRYARRRGLERRCVIARVEAREDVAVAVRRQRVEGGLWITKVDGVPVPVADEGRVGDRPRARGTVGASAVREPKVEERDGAALQRRRCDLRRRRIRPRFPWSQAPAPKTAAALTSLPFSRSAKPNCVISEQISAILAGRSTPPPYATVAARADAASSATTRRKGAIDPRLPPPWGGAGFLSLPAEELRRRYKYSVPCRLNIHGKYALPQIAFRLLPSLNAFSIKLFPLITA